MQRQNIIDEVLEKVRAAAQSLAAEGVLPTEFDQSRIVVEPPRDVSFGDLATNAALVLAKTRAGSRAILRSRSRRKCAAMI